MHDKGLIRHEIFLTALSYLPKYSLWEKSGISFHEGKHCQKGFARETFDKASNAVRPYNARQIGFCALVGRC